MFHVAAFDPGETCGWSEFVLDGDHCPAYIERAAEFPGTPKDFSVFWTNWRARLTGEAVLVVEDWVAWNPAANGRVVMELIGMAKLLCYQEGVQMVLQAPQVRLDIPDTRKGLGAYWTKNLQSHDNRRQATRHGLAWIINKKLHLPTIQAIHPR